MDNVNEEVVQLYLDDIIPNRFQPREVFDDQALKELAVSIREHGVIQPILVRKFGEKYEIIAGERRYKASTMAGLTKIPAIVKNLDDKEASKVALIENLQRRDLTPVEEARTYQKILDLDQMTQEQLAKTMGKSQSAVSNKLRLLTLPDEVQEALLNNKISERHARSLLNAPKAAQVGLLKEIIDNKMTVRELDSKIKEMTGDGSTDNDTTSGGVTTAPVQDNNFLMNNGGNNMNGFDPTAVDINKIREQSVDINAMNNPAPSEPKNIDSLLSRGGEIPQTNKFIPDNKDTTIEKTTDGNEVIGNGLLAGMPVIQDVPNTSNDIFSPPVVDTIQTQPVTPEVPSAPAADPMSLFSTPAPAQVPIENTVVPQVAPAATPSAPPAMSGGDGYGFGGIDFSDIQIPQDKIDLMVDSHKQNPDSIGQAPTEQSVPTGVVPVVPSAPAADPMSLFSTPAPAQVPIENTVVPQVAPAATPSAPPAMSGGDGYGFGGIDFSDIQIPQDKIDLMVDSHKQNPDSIGQAPTEQSVPTGVVPVVPTVVDVNNGVNEIKNMVTNLSSQGYKVVVDELNLDNEVQLIVRFIKG